MSIDLYVPWVTTHLHSSGKDNSVPGLWRFSLDVLWILMSSG